MNSILKTHFRLINKSVVSHNKNMPFRVSSNSEYVPISTISIRQNYIRNNILNFKTFRVNQWGNVTDRDPKTYYDILNANINRLSYCNYSKKVTYKNLFSNTYYDRTGTISRVLNCGRNSYISQPYSVYHIDQINDKITPLYILVTKRNYIRYIRQTILLRKDIHPGAVKLIINSELATKGGEFELFRRQFDKYVKNPLIEDGVEIEFVENFDSIFNRLNKPISNTISGYLNKLKSISSEFLNMEREKNAFHDNKFKLEY